LLSTLFDAPTPLELSLLLRARDATRVTADGSYVVSLVDTGHSPQVFCVHPDGSGTRQAIDWYHPLLSALGMAAAAVSCEEDVYLELPQLAARHVRALHKQTLPRSLCLVGVGFGGNLAQEMAVQLELAGVEVRRVVIIQSVASAELAGPSIDYLVSLPRNLRRALRALQTLRADEAKSRRLLWVRKVRQYARSIAGGASRFDRGKDGRSPALEDPVDLAAVPACYQSLSAPQYNALLRHCGRPCAAPITLIRAHRSGLTPLDEAHGFASLSQAAVDVRILDCSADALLDHQFDTALNAVLREVLASDAQELAWRPLLPLSP
jgi:hypothetical protein